MKSENPELALTKLMELVNHSSAALIKAESWTKTERPVE